MGNLLSIKSALSYLGHESIISSSNSIIENSDILILPGVGSFKEAMDFIIQNKINKSIEIALLKGSKILGICLGMQLLCSSSVEDGFCKGLSYINYSFSKFTDEDVKDERIPHIGFNSVKFNKNDILYEGLTQDTFFYFVHSYRAEKKINTNYKFLYSEFNYGNNFIASFSYGNIYGTQFHPEKSQTNGLVILKNFIEKNK